MRKIKEDRRHPLKLVARTFGVTTAYVQLVKAGKAWRRKSIPRSALATPPATPVLPPDAETIDQTDVATSYRDEPQQAAKNADVTVVHTTIKSTAVAAKDTPDS